MYHTYLPECTETEYEIGKLIQEAVRQCGKRWVSTAKIDGWNKPRCFNESTWEGTIEYAGSAYLCRGYLNGGGYFRFVIHDHGPFELIAPATLHFGGAGDQDPGPHCPAWALVAQDAPLPNVVYEGWDREVFDIGCRALRLHHGLAYYAVCQLLWEVTEETVREWLHIQIGEHARVAEFFKTRCARAEVNGETTGILFCHHLADIIINEVHAEIRRICTADANVYKVIDSVTKKYANRFMT